MMYLLENIKIYVDQKLTKHIHPLIITKLVSQENDRFELVRIKYTSVSMVDGFEWGRMD